MSGYTTGKAAVAMDVDTTCKAAVAMDVDKMEVDPIRKINISTDMKAAANLLPGAALKYFFIFFEDIWDLYA